ncbi:MAG: 23S rRNA (adenine(2503)-C(2))-methyltransferase RlmN [Cryomorphaceae bacterium]|nr:23S rRNA (adenine(2503)-C(2))-methyltransferase RlmN [Cryomorphaceae bacterium]
MEKKDIRSLPPTELHAFFKTHGEPAFRARQVEEWVWKRSCKDFNEMSNIPKSLRLLLENHFTIHGIRVDNMQRSVDGTIKNGVKLHDGRVVESVLIPTEKRITACISSQVGCSLDCHFCATGKLTRMRNLNAEEIYDQVVTIQQQALQYFNRPLTNIVYMGMGEPLLNYANVLKSIEKITGDEGLGMSPKRITVSTVGIAKMMKKLADDNPRCNLALSLHSARNEVRETIMPITKSNPIEDLREAMLYWYEKTGKKVTFEYVIWKGINDTEKDIAALVKLCKQVPSKVNIIEYNTIGDDRFQMAGSEVIQKYIDALHAINVIAKVRQSRGSDIDAACGQLANKNLANVAV